ncbi:nucleosome-remodeling factor subunit NURF301-like [Octopus sinensis]|uniref:Nucleosome-remodeling factor subunit NURF301-like n=1 Tax=Octopus sinensis TaxID=2607531 RepID=A0A6P7TXF0_9MOLL|nr:nucleosome-remodeling factor subunit NURF301-like [Octopus sinensis]
MDNSILQIRRQTCCNVMKMMLEKVERHEKNSRRRISHVDSSSVRQRKIISQRIMSQLHKQKESLKRSIIRKRTMTEQSIRREVKSEVQKALDNSSQPTTSKIKPEKKEARTVERSSNRHSTTMENAPKDVGDVYCVCRTPYDNTKYSYF